MRFFLALVVSCAALFAATLEVNITDINKQKEGFVIIAVCDPKVHFPCKKSNAAASGKQKVAAHNAKFSFELPNGVYAVAAAHDENDNEIVDKNIFGVPVEGYALSGDARRPNFDKSKFTLQGDMKINLKMGY